jgi:hypothetical protein
VTPRTLARRRPLQLGGLLLAATALGLATAPAALAEDTSAPQADPSTDAGSPQVLLPDTTPTPSGTSTTGTPGDSSSSAGSSTNPSDQAGSAAQVAAANPAGAHFGTGKLSLTLDTTADPLPTGTVLDPTGGQLELRFSQVGGAPSTASGICDLTVPTSSNPFLTGCTFRPGHTLPTASYGLGPMPTLPADSVFTLTLVQPPTSGQVLAAPVSIQGWTDTTASTVQDSDLRLAVQHRYRTLGVAVVDGAPAGTTVQLCPATAGACATGSATATATTDASGLATFAGGYLPGDYLVTRGGAVTPFTVPAATTTTERDTPLRLSVGVPVATPTPVAPPTTPPTSAPGTATAAAPTLAAGRQQTVTAGGFTPGETVRGTLYSTPIDLGTAVADAQGVVTFTFTVPADLEVGVHTVTALGLTSGTTSTVTFAVTTTETAALATTGVDVAPLIGLGVVALGAGSALAFTGTRRRRAA